MKTRERFTKIRKQLDKILVDHETLEISPELLQQLRDILLTPITDNKVLNKKLKSKIWRLNYCYSVVNKDGKRVPFVMNRAQFKVYLSLLKHKRLINLKSRQQGISTLWLIAFVDDCIYYPDTKSVMISIGNSQQQNLLKRAAYTWENMEYWAKSRLKVERKSHNKQRKLEFTNNSEMEIGSSFRGDTVTNLHISELGYIAFKDKAKSDEIISGTLLAASKNSKVIIESTAKGENKFADLYRKAEVDKKRALGLEEYKLPALAYHPIFLSWLEDPTCNEEINIEPNEALHNYEKELAKQGLTLTRTQKNFWLSQHELAGDDIFREFPATPQEAFFVSTEGAIFAKHYQEYAKRNIQLPSPHEKYNWMPSMPVYVSFDLGVDDIMFLIFMQVIQGKVIILKEKAFTDLGLEDLSFYLNQYNVENKYRPKGNEGYRYEQLIFPHDGKQRKLAEQTTSPEDFMTDKGWDVVISPSRSTDDNIYTREYMSRIYIDENRCPDLHAAFMNYRREFDNTRGVFKEKPVHDDFSHPMDSLRYGLTQLEELIVEDDDVKGDKDEEPEEEYLGEVI